MMAGAKSNAATCGNLYKGVMKVAICFITTRLGRGQRAEWFSGIRLVQPVNVGRSI